MTNPEFEPLFTFVSYENNLLKYKCNICETALVSAPIPKIVPWLRLHLFKWHQEALDQYDDTVKNDEMMGKTTSMEQNALVHEQKNIDKPFQVAESDREKSSIVSSLTIKLPPLYLEKNGQMTTHKKEKSNELVSNENEQFISTLEKPGLTFRKNKLRRLCDRCGKDFFSTYELNRHVEIVHKKNFTLKCTKCGKKFGQKGNLMRHIKGHDSDSSKIYITVENDEILDAIDLKEEVIESDEKENDQNDSQ